MRRDGYESDVEIVYATRDRQHVVRLKWQAGLTATDAAMASGLLRLLPPEQQAAPAFGRFGARLAADEVLSPGDRVEICRPLQADPRAARRTLAARGYTIGACGRIQQTGAGSGSTAARAQESRDSASSLRSSLTTRSPSK